MMPTRGRLADPRARAVLDALHSKPLNFDLARREEFTPAQGWKFDEYCQRLPREVPGPPVLGGSWQIAQQLVRDYEFADPSIVRAVYYSDRPLENRTMLLQGRFYGLRFHFGVRVDGVLDETREVHGREVRVWGWSYATLQGHLEMGQMDYEVWKWLDSGDVEFRITSFSRPAAISNPIVRFGFRLFGRSMQVKFARHACQRIVRLTVARLRDRPPWEVNAAVPSAADRMTVGPAGHDTPARRRLDRYGGTP